MGANDRLVRIFISSTFRDFIEERDLLVKKVFPQLRQRCKARFVEILEIDLRWGITEEQSKRGETLKICLEEIDKCRPSAPVFFIGLLGERYGWIPEKDYYPKEVLKDEKYAWVQEHVGGKSVTELEILHGILRNPKMLDKSFFYFRKDGYEHRHWDNIAAYHAGITPPIAPDDFTNAKSEDPESDARKQQELKQKICDVSLEWDPVYYDRPADLENRILKDLWSKIDAIFPASEVPDALEQERLDHQVFRDRRTKAYVERAGLYEGLDAHAEGEGPPLRVVTGESGSGKTALISAWLNRKQDGFVFFHFVGATPQSVHAASILHRMLDALRREIGLAGTRIPDDPAEMAVLLPDWLERLSQKGGGLILLDALNQLESARDRELWWWPEKWPENIRVIFSTLPGDVWRQLDKRGCTSDEYLLNVPLLQPDEKRQILDAYRERFTKKLERGQQDRIMEASQTENPLFLRTVMDELRLRSYHVKLSQNLVEMLSCPDIPALFVYVLKNLERDFTPPHDTAGVHPQMVHTALGLMGAAKRGLTEGELLELLSTAEKPAESPVPRHYWAPLYLALEESLVSRDGRLTFFHDYLRQAVMREYLDAEGERKNIHNRYGDVAWAWNTDAFSPSIQEYGLAYGAMHLRLSSDGDRLWKLLSDNNFINAQISLLGNYTATFNSLNQGIIHFLCEGETCGQHDKKICYLLNSYEWYLHDSIIALQFDFVKWKEKGLEYLAAHLVQLMQLDVKGRFDGALFLFFSILSCSDPSQNTTIDASAKVISSWIQNNCGRPADELDNNCDWFIEPTYQGDFDCFLTTRALVQGAGWPIALLSCYLPIGDIDKLLAIAPYSEANLRASVIEFLCLREKWEYAKKVAMWFPDDKVSGIRKSAQVIALKHIDDIRAGKFNYYSQALRGFASRIDAPCTQERSPSILEALAGKQTSYRTRDELLFAAFLIYIESGDIMQARRCLKGMDVFVHAPYAGAIYAEYAAVNENIINVARQTTAELPKPVHQFVLDRMSRRLAANGDIQTAYNLFAISVNVTDELDDANAIAEGLSRLINSLFGAGVELKYILPILAIISDSDLIINTLLAGALAACNARYLQNATDALAHSEILIEDLQKVRSSVELYSIQIAKAGKIRFYCGDIAAAELNYKKAIDAFLSSSASGHEVEQAFTNIIAVLSFGGISKPDIRLLQWVYQTVSTMPRLCAQGVRSAVLESLYKNVSEPLVIDIISDAGVEIAGMHSQLDRDNWNTWLTEQYCKMNEFLESKPEKALICDQGDFAREYYGDLQPLPFAVAWSNLRDEGSKVAKVFNVIASCINEGKWGRGKLILDDCSAMLDIGADLSFAISKALSAAHQCIHH